MKSIQSKILILILGFVLSGCLLCGFSSIAYTSDMLKKEMSGNINLIYEGDNIGEVNTSQDESNFIVISDNDAYKLINNLLKINLGITFGVTGAACFSSIIFVKHYIIKPLKRVRDAAGKITEGNWNIRPDGISKDEFGELAGCLFRTMQQLKCRFTMINSMAYRDSMTGVGNKAAYDRMAARINYDIKKGTGDFFLIVIDINNLKIVNDTYGHIAGDDLICCISGCIREVFSCGQIYRIGGDEFAVIIEKTNSFVCHELIREFKERVHGLFIKGHSDISISAACGYSAFDKETDRTLSDVFARADYSMYQDKQNDKKNKGE